MKLPRILSEMERAILITAPRESTPQDMWSRVSEMLAENGSQADPEQVGRAVDSLTSDGFLREETARWFMTDSGWEVLELVLNRRWALAERPVRIDACPN
jgi:hypothetical protein